MNIKFVNGSQITIIKSEESKRSNMEYIITKLSRGGLESDKEKENNDNRTD